MDFLRIILVFTLTLVGANFATLKREFLNQNHKFRRPGRSAKAQTESLANLAQQVGFDKRLLEGFRNVGRNYWTDLDYWTYSDGFYKSTLNGEVNPILKWPFIF